MTFSSIGDTYVSAQNPETNYGTLDELRVDPDSAGPDRLLVQFDVSAIPAGSTIHSARLDLCRTQLSVGALGREHHAHMMLDSWDELQATWDNTSEGVAVETDSAFVLAGITCIGLQVETDVQAWIDGAPNYGWEVGDSNENANASGVRYASREHANTSIRPQLVISWTPPATTDTPTPTPTPTPVPTPTPTPTPVVTPTPTPPGSVTVDLIAVADAYIHSNAGDHNHGDDDIMQVNPKTNDIARSMVRFDLSSIPPGATVQSATLTLCVRSSAGAAAGRIHQLRPILDPWTEAGVTWDTQPAAGSVSAPAVYPGGQICMGFAVEADSQLWLDGTPNYGWLVRDSAEATGADAKIEYQTREDGDGANGPFLTITYTP